MKRNVFFLFSALSLMSLNAFAGNVSGSYRMQLYFGDSKPFEDEMVVERTETAVKGMMHVPKDFDGPLENISEKENVFEFDLLVPKNASRPEMLFHYKAFVLLPEAENLTGFVTLVKSDGVETPERPYIGSFVAFRKK